MFQMIKNNRKRQGAGQPTPKGQAMVEFALILLVLLLIIFVIIESARLFQANLTVQNAARAAGRYAITGEFDASCLADTPPCENPRLESIKNVALAELEGLNLDPNAAFEEENYYLIEVYGLDNNDNWVLDQVGGPGDAILVRVTYRLGIVTPLLNAIARTVRVRGQVVYNNEQFRQTSLTSGDNPGDDDAPDLPPLPDTAPTPTATPQLPVLAITKTASLASVDLSADQSDQVTYDVQITNAGGLATGVVFTDTLPSQVSYIGGAPVSCTEPASGPGGRITCNLTDLAPGTGTSVSFTVDPESAGTAVNTATVSSNEVGQVSDTASTVILNPAAADLNVRKTVTSTQKTVGQPFEYEIRVTNLGIADATNVLVTDTVPAELDILGVTSSQGTCTVSGQQITCDNPGPLVDGGADQVVTIRVQATQTGQIANTATASADEPDPDPGNNSSTAIVQVDPAADMGIVKTVEPANVGIREFMTYTLEVTNYGPVTATNVTVIDDLHETVGLVSVSTPVGTCEQQPDTSAEIICRLGTMSPGTTVSIEIVAIPTVYEPGQTIPNTASVSADELDQNTSNNSWSASVLVEPRADLAIGKSHSNPRVHVNDPLVYTLVVTNSADSFTEAPNVVVTDLLPDTLSFAASSPSGICEEVGTQEISCSLGNMPVGAVETIEITVDPQPVSEQRDGGGDLLNRALVSYGGGNDYEDLDTSNNSDEITTYIGPGQEAITVNPDCGDPGATITVSGTGWTTSGEQNVTLSVLDPSGAVLTTSNVGLVSPDSSGTWTTNPTIDFPSDIIAPDDWGFYTILAEGREDEEAEATFQFPCPQPDLTATGLNMASAQAVVGEFVEFTVNITNLNEPDFNADVSGFDVALYFNPPEVGATYVNDTAVAVERVQQTLGPGDTIPVTLQVEEGFSLDDLGTSDVYVMVDPVSSDGDPGAIDERLENNNVTAPLVVEVLARPVAENDSGTTDEDVDVTINVTSNDTDADNNLDPSSAAVVDGPTNGSVTNNNDGTFTYTPDPDFNGDDSFTYNVDDLDGLTSNTAMVSITVNPVNDAPEAVDDTATTPEDTAVDIDVAANDTDIDGNLDPASAALTAGGGPNNGTLVNNGDGTFTYTPNADFAGDDSFTYEICDSGQDGDPTTDADDLCASATATITVDPVNDAPVAQDDGYSVDEDNVLNVVAPGVLGNDSDVDGDALTAVLVSAPADGGLTLNADGSFSYTPDANFNGSDSFTYMANDGTADSNVATVSITVNAVNDAPVATGESYSTNEDETLAVTAPGVLGNDTDVEGDALTAVLVSAPTDGGLTLNADGSFSYTPDADFNGSDSFTYMANDGAADSNVATVTIAVGSVNDAPVATDDAYSVDEDNTLSVAAAAGVLGNDSDVDGDTLTAAPDAGPSNGSLTLNSDGSFTYTPDANFNGTDSFTYTVSDGNGGSDTATATITVNAVDDDSPVANGDSATTDEDAAVVIDVAANDTDPDGNLDPTSVTITSGPSNGSLVNHGDGTLTYTPAADFNGTDSFTYEVCDTTSLCDTATVSITVSAVDDDPPVANGDSATTDEDTPVTIDVAANDTDADGNLDPTTVTVVSGPGNGSLVNHGDGTLSYTPDADFNGNDSFTYEVCDTSSLCDTATVSITVSAVDDDPPVANADSATTDEDTLVTIDVAANDTDPDGNLDPTTVTITSGPSNGSLVNHGDGTLTYTPAANFNGNDSFSYEVCDTTSLCDTAIVDITVSSVDDGPPVAGDDSATTGEDNDVTINVLANDSDPDDDPLTISAVTQPTNGTAEIIGSTITYTPDPNFCGSGDSFTYTVSDGNGGSDTATVTITNVTCVNDDPVAVDDSASTSAGTPVTINVLANDTDVEGDTLSVTGASDPPNGSVTINLDDTITYTPDAGFSGSDSFTYTISDGNGGTDTGTVSITVN